MGRHRLARAAGDAEAAQREFDAWLDAPRDTMADCEACEAGSQGRWHVATGDDAAAIERWRPVLDGELVCSEEPHRVLAYSLLPLLRLGRRDEARANHLRGYRMARGVTNLRATIGRHIEFCALTGNEARGLEILSEHAAFLAPGAEDAETRLEFLTTTLVLLRRLIALGLGGLELAGVEPGALDAAGSDEPATVARTAELIDAQAAALCARFDARNGHAEVSQRTADRLARPPLLASLALGSSAALPQAGQPRDTAAEPAPQPTSQPAPHPVPNSSPDSAAALDALVAEARRLTDLRHPQARRAWERVAAGGFALPEAVGAHVERSRARALMEQDPAASRAAFSAVAERFAALGEPAESLEARGSAAFAAFLAGEPQVAQTEAVVICAEAEAAHAAGGLTPRQYLNARSLPAYLAFNAFAQQAQAAEETDEGEEAAGSLPPDPGPAASLLLAELDLADRLGDPGRAGAYCRMLAQVALLRQDYEPARTHLAAARERFLAGGQPWDASDPESILARLALQSGEPAAAEQYARDALIHGGDLVGPETAAQLGSLLVEALSRQEGRELDLVDAALRASQLWEGLSEPDTLHNRFAAARAYLKLERHGEAAALFDELMPQVSVPYDDAGVAMTREQYGDCLVELGEHRKAAEQYLAAAALVQDDPDNQAPHARLAWSAAQALQSAGMEHEALPAYRRAAQLWGALGNIPARVRCLRSAAWLVGWSDGAWTAALTEMRAVAAELAAVPARQRTQLIEAEVANTRDQIDQMLGRLREAEAAKTEAAEAEAAETQTGLEHSAEDAG